MAKDRATVRAARLEDAIFLQDKLRESDILEIAASTGRRPAQALSLSFSTSEKVWTGCIDDIPFLIFGVSSTSVMSPVGVPWLLGTDAIDREGIAVAKRSRHYVGEMRKGFLSLENYTDNRHKSAHRWLRWCGFHMDDPKPWGVLNLPFRRFWLD